MSQTSFPVNPELTALAIAFKNPDTAFIADSVLPRIAKAQKFKYRQYSKDQFFTVPSNLLGRKSEPNEVEFSSTELTSETQGFGLVDYVPEDDMKVWAAMPKASGAYDPMQVATIGTVTLMKTAREQRAANLIFNAATYAAAQQQTLAGTAQWSDYTNSDPALAMQLAADTMLVKPNALVIGRQAFTRLRRHPKVVAAAFPISQTGNGSVTAQQLADILELQNVFVGEAYMNTAGKGLPVNMQRVWGKHAALLNISKQQAETDMPTFGFTADFQGLQVQSFFEPKRGVNGVTGVKVVEQVKELIVAQDCGYFFQNATV